MGSSPVSCSVLTSQSLEPASDSVSPSLSLPLPCSHSVCLSLSQKTNKHKKKNLKKKQQIKTTMRYHLTPVRMSNINNSGNNRCWRGCRERGCLLHCWWQCKLVQPLWKTVWRFLKKLEIELPYDPAIALLGIYPLCCFKGTHAPPCL